MIPGSNILNMALRLITKQVFQYSAFISRATNNIGVDVATYAAPVTVTGSVQPVPRNLYQAYGLDLQKNHQNFFLPQSVIDVTRDVSGDKFTFNNQIYQCLSKTDWAAVDGWVQVMAVQVPN